MINRSLKNNSILSFHKVLISIALSNLIYLLKRKFIEIKIQTFKIKFNGTISSDHD